MEGLYPNWPLWALHLSTSMIFLGLRKLLMLSCDGSGGGHGGGVLALAVVAYEILYLLVMVWIEVGEKTESGHGVWWVCSRVFNTLYRGYHLKAYGLVMLDLLMIVG